MNYFKQFISSQRKIELKEPYIIVCVNISPKIYEYLQTLCKIKLEDGLYHQYCGKIKFVINNFLNYWTEIIDECVKEADTLHYTTDKKKIVWLFEETAEIQMLKQEQFSKLFLPIKSDEEQSVWDELEELLQLRLKDLNELKEFAEGIDTKEAVQEFLDRHLELSIIKKNDSFSLAHTNIAMQLAQRSHEIKVSITEILLRMQNNLKKMNEEKDEILNKLMEELYEANKNRVMATRQEINRITDTAELDWTIKKIREKIEAHQSDRSLLPLEEEVSYWEKRLANFIEIESNIGKWRNELYNVTEYLERYNKMKVTETPDSKKTCWENMGENFRLRKVFVQEAFIEATKALITFFAVRDSPSVPSFESGRNRIFYKDEIGFYNIDDYGHQVYVFDCGNKVYHTKCDGTYVQYEDTEKYYYDKWGRYILSETGEKTYQCAPCTSEYKLGEDELFKKVTKDCGHSEAENPDCKMQFKNKHNIELFPMVDPINIKQTLQPETVKYLWDTFGHILPDALYDTGLKRSKNPLYYLANRLISNKYHKNTTTELRSKTVQADQFRTDVYKKRKVRAVAAALKWKAGLVPSRKPEEFYQDDYKVACAAQAAQQNLTNQLLDNYY